MARCVVFPTKFEPSYGENFPILPLSEALTATYRSDAHFTLGTVVGADEQVRLRKSSDQPFPTSGVEFGAVVVDGDAPADRRDDVDVWWEEQRVRIPWPCAWYRTRGGYRLLWRLLSPVTSPAEFEDLVARVLASLRVAGVEGVDQLTDWTRFFRLPFVVRDGRPQMLPAEGLGDIPLLPPLDQLEAVPVSSPSGLGAALVQARLPASSRWLGPWEAGTGTRNKNLFSTARMVVEALDGAPEEVVRAVVRAINDEWCSPPKPLQEVDSIVTNAMRYTVPAPPPAPAAPPPARTPVVISPAQHVRALRECQAVLGGTEGIYQQSGRLVRLVRDIDAGLAIEPIPKPAIRVLLEEKVEFMEETRNKGGDVFNIPRDMPRDLVDSIEAASDNPVPELQEVISTPTLLPNGTLVTEAGYYPELQAFLEPFTSALPAIPGGAPAALRIFHDLLTDFPFSTPAHRSVAISALITPIVRSMIDGPVPLVVFDGTTPSSGKSLLADISSILVTGQDAPKQPLVGEEEFEKRVTALLSSGVRAVLIDNVTRPIGGASMDALLTADVWTGRILGASRMVKVRSRAQWMVTGNNVTIQGDLSRRAIRCYLAPEMERPEERSDYKYPRLREHVRTNRALFVSAALTVVGEWLRARGGKGAGEQCVALGSYESWSDTVRSALVWLGEDDPVATQDELRADSAVGTWAQILDSLVAVWGTGSSFSAKEVYDALFRGARKPGVGKDVWNALEGALDEFLPQPSVRGLSALFRKWLGRVVGGKRLTRVPRDRRGNLFTVRTLGDEQQQPGAVGGFGVGRAADA